MVPVAWRNLLEDRTRLAISVGGVALSTMLVLLLNGFLAGMYHQITAYVDTTPAEFYVSQKGVANFQGATSVIPGSTVERVERVEGVTSAVPVFSQYVMLDLHGKKVTTVLVGYEPSRGGGPRTLSAGRAVENPDEVVMDRVLAQRHGLRLGDTLEVQGSQFQIVGLSDGTASWMVSMIFLRHDAATSLLRVGDATSFVLVTTDGDPASASRLEDTLEEFNVVRREKIASNDLDFLGSIFSIPLRMMVVIAVGIGAMLVGLTIYSATVERVREYGVLKAIGMRNRTLYGIVARQALGATTLGFAAGLVLVGLVAAGIQQAWPQFLIVIDRDSVLQAAVGALVMALVASFLPARYAGNIDPARVFRR